MVSVLQLLLNSGNPLNRLTTSPTSGSTTPAAAAHMPLPAVFPERIQARASEDYPADCSDSSFRKLGTAASQLAVLRILINTPRAAYVEIKLLPP